MSNLFFKERINKYRITQGISGEKMILVSIMKKVSIKFEY